MAIFVAFIDEPQADLVATVLFPTRYVGQVVTFYDYGRRAPRTHEVDLEQFRRHIIVFSGDELAGNRIYDFRLIPPAVPRAPCWP
jgi:hypothetical protein